MRSIPILLTAGLLLSPFTLFAQSTAPALELPKIDRYPSPSKFNPRALEKIPIYNPKNDNAFQVDLRWKDVSALDLRTDLESLQHAAFDTSTKWPDASRMPLAAQFDPARQIELGKNPGLGIRALHKRGITGRGVGVAIIDQTLLVDHQEYADRLKLYEEIAIFPLSGSAMHTPAVASIAVGKTIGVAPEADLYLIGTQFGEVVIGQAPQRTFENAAQAVRRIIEINQQLPAGKQIRVISMSVGWGPGERGYDKIVAAVRDASAAGVFVVSSSLQETYGFKFHGLGRSPLADPDDFNSYTAGSWWAGTFAKWDMKDRLLVPMDARTFAGCGGTDEYAFMPQGGWSWCVPYIAASYALAIQVDPSITYQRFWELVLKSGRTTKANVVGVQRDLGPILDLPALIDVLQNAQKTPAP